MSRFGTILAPVTAIAVVLTLAGCAAGTPMQTPPSPSPTYAPTGDGTLRIGTILPATATAQVAGVEVAVREINEQGGINGVPVEVFHRTSGDAATETAEASLASLVEKGIDVVIGPASPELAERLVEPAAAANVVLVSPSAIGLGSIEDSGMLFSTALGVSASSAALADALLAAEAGSIAYLATDDDLATQELAALTTFVEGGGGEIVAESTFDASTTTFSSVISTLKKAKPDAVVVSVATAEQATALLIALDDAGVRGSSIWLTSRSTVDYSVALPAGLLEGATGQLALQPDASFVARLRQADPSLISYAFAAEAYDATIMAALAVLLGEDDGGPAISRQLRSVSTGGIPCESFGECVSVLATEPDIDYVGRSGPVDLSETGDAARGTFTLVTYGATNSITPPSAAEPE